MAIRSISQLKAWFRRGMYPTEEQFADWMDSYIHKEEDRIGINQVDGLATELNGKYSAASGEELARQQATTAEKLEIYKEASDKSLENLREEAEAVVLNATYAFLTNGNRRYTLAADDKEKFKNYFDLKKSAPVVLRSLPADGEVTEWGDNKQEEVYLLESVEVKYPQYTMNFTKYNSNDRTIPRIYLRMTKLSTTGKWVNTATMGYSERDVSEYKYDRYEPMESFDMNDFTESGGIAAFLREATDTYPAIEGTNIPEGFTDFQGYVLSSAGLSNDKCAIQVITDNVLKKTMMRSTYINSEDRSIEWSPWTEIGGGKAELSFNVLYLNTENLDDYSEIEDGALNDDLLAQFAAFSDLEKPFEVVVNDGNKYVCDNVYYTKNSSRFTLYADIPSALQADFSGASFVIRYNIGSDPRTISVSISTAKKGDVIFLTENADGRINASDKNWNTLASKLNGGETPAIWLKSVNNSDGYCPASCEFTKDATTGVVSGFIEIIYPKTVDEKNELWAERWTFSNGVGLSSQYQHEIKKIQTGDPVFVFELPDESLDSQIEENSDLAVQLQAFYRFRSSKNVFIKVGNTVFPASIDVSDNIDSDDVTVISSYIILMAYDHTYDENKRIVISAVFNSGLLSGSSSYYGVMPTDEYIKRSDVHLVLEYPTDLSDYGDGSIFIKQTTPTATTTPIPTVTPTTTI